MCVRQRQQVHKWLTVRGHLGLIRSLEPWPQSMRRCFRVVTPRPSVSDRITCVCCWVPFHSCRKNVHTHTKECNLLHRGSTTDMEEVAHLTLYISLNTAAGTGKLDGWRMEIKSQVGCSSVVSICIFRLQTCPVKVQTRPKSYLKSVARRSTNSWLHLTWSSDATNIVDFL